MSIWAWSAYDPTKALPEELRFDMLNASESRIGQILYTEFKPFKISRASTPWGEAELKWGKEGVVLRLNNREFARINTYLLKSKVELCFPNGKVLGFRPEKGRNADMDYSDGIGSVTVREENGDLPIGQTSQSLQMTKEEVKRMPKDQRPRSVETGKYTQYRISVSGTLPVKHQDILIALSLSASYLRLITETPT